MKSLILWTLVCSLLTSLAFSAATPQNERGDQGTKSRAHSAPQAGEQVFKDQCSRCHTPPMTISPRVTGTVIMHMRVRARISRQDEQLLLKYMTP